MELQRLDYILLGAITGVVFYLYLYPRLKEKMSPLNQDNILKVDMNTCSRECCKHSQWRAPHMNNPDKEHVGTNLMCNGGNGGGCVCMKKEEFQYLSSRANNGLDSF